MLNVDEMIALLSMPLEGDDGDPLLHVRDVCILEVIYSAGLRVSECVGPFGEDGHRLIQRNAAANLSRIRRIALDLVRKSTGKGMSITRLRTTCGCNPNRLLRILAGEVSGTARGSQRRVLDKNRKKLMNKEQSAQNLPTERPNAMKLGRDRCVEFWRIQAILACWCLEAKAGQRNRTRGVGEFRSEIFLR